MKHSRNLVRLVILLALILIGLFHVPGGGLQPKASANKAPGALPSAVAPAPDIWSSPPRVGVLSDGRLEVFTYRVDSTPGSLWHIWQETPTSGWSSWQSLGSGLTRGPVVARNADGRLEVFAIGSFGEVVHAWQLKEGGWSGLESLGALGGGVANSWFDVERNAQGGLEVIIIGWDGRMYHNSRPV